jgi:phage recombination protein Bet
MSNLEFTDKELAAIKAEFCPGFNDTQFEVCMTFCRVRNLLPGKHVVFQLRASKEWDEAAGAKVATTKIIFITTIDASRLIAQRTGQYGGQAPEQYIYLDANGAPGIVSEVPLPQLPMTPGVQALPREPWAVRTTVYRKDFDQPVSSVARFDAYAATYSTKEGPVLNSMWARRGPEQLAKCSEMLSLRKAFPEELGGLYLAEEFKPGEDDKPAPVTPASVVPLPPSVPKVDHTPAEGKQEPRPGETKTEFHTTEVPATLPEHSGETLVAKETPKEKVLAAVPGLKTASALPPPEEKKKRGRPAKKSPDNGRDLAAEGGITDADIANAGTPPPVVDEAANLAAAQEFVASVSEFTATEAAAQGLPDPPDYGKIPEGEQKDGFIARFRELEKINGVTNKALGDYIKSQTGKSGSKTLTVREWTETLAKLESAKENGTLKELVKGTK